jgi:hypothetical protein
MRPRWHSPWVEGDAADPLLALLVVDVVAAGIALLLMH